MVSTRHSAPPNEQLVSLETVLRKQFTRSPSPKKRKLDEDTPNQKFEDARGTPFAQRANSSRPVKKNLSSNNGEEEYETADERMTEVAAEVLDDQLSIAKSIVLDKPAEDPSEVADSVDLSESQHSDPDDDDAPEVISNVAGALAAKALEASKLDAIRTQTEEIRERRRKREQKLRAQQLVKEKLSAAPLATPEEEGPAPPDSDEEAPKSGLRTIVPRLLPDEILNSVQVVQNDSAVVGEAKESNHQRFEPKKEHLSMQKGPLTVRVLKRQRRDLAPVQVASVANTRNQWLYQRGQNKTVRRMIKKPLV